MTRWSRPHDRPARHPPLPPPRTRPPPPAPVPPPHPAHRPGPLQHRVRPRRVPPQTHHVLAMRVGDGLAHRSFRPRRTPRQHGRDGAQPQHVQDLALHPHRDQPVSQHGIAHGARCSGVRCPARHAPPPPPPSPPPPRTNPTRSSAVGPLPHSAPSPDSDTRSLPRVTFASSQPPFSAPTRWSAGMRTSVKKTSLNACSPVISTSARTSIPGERIGQTKYEMPRMLGRRRIGAGQQDAPAGDVGVAGPHLLPVEDVVVAVALGPQRQRRQVGAGAGLAEQLAPELLARQQRPQPPFLLLGRPGIEQRRPGPPDADGVDGPAHPGRPQLLVDDQLRQRIGVTAERRRPVWHHIARFSELASRRLWVSRQPLPYIGAAGVIVSGQADVHPGKRRLMGAPEGTPGGRSTGSVR